MSRNVVIIGANRGIGLELTKAYVNNGDSVTAICRKPSEELKSTGANVVEGVDVKEDNVINTLSEKLPAEQIDILTIDGSVPKDRNISILQLDIEGFEKQALMGALETIKRCKPILILEDDHGFTKSDWFKDNILSLDYNIDKKLSLWLGASFLLFLLLPALNIQRKQQKYQKDKV